MDNPFAQGGISAIIIAALYATYKVVKHVRMKSKCCGSEFEGTIDLSPTDDQRKDALVSEKPQVVVPAPAA